MAKRDERSRAIHRLCFDAAALCMALALSYIEAVLPLGAWIPLPGVKPGLANIVITLVFFTISASDAAAGSFCRVLVSGMLFGSPVSAVISLGGAAAAFIMLCIISRVRVMHKRITFIGVSVLCAAAHSGGQLSAVAAVTVSAGAFSYLPVMLAAACVFGTVNGALLNVMISPVGRILKNTGTVNEKDSIS